MRFDALIIALQTLLAANAAWADTPIPDMGPGTDGSILRIEGEAPVTVTAIDPISGRVKWSRTHDFFTDHFWGSYGGFSQGLFPLQTNPSPLPDALLILRKTGGSLIALDSMTGDVQWIKQRSFENIENNKMYATYLQVVDGITVTVCVGCATPNKSTVEAYDARGAWMWSYPGRLSKINRDPSGQTVYIGSEGRLVAVDARTGDTKFDILLPSPSGDNPTNVRGVAVSPRGKVVVFVNSMAVYVLSAHGEVEMTVRFNGHTQLKRIRFEEDTVVFESEFGESRVDTSAV